jgi:hypothetical protein
MSDIGGLTSAIGHGVPKDTEIVVLQGVFGEWIGPDLTSDEPLQPYWDNNWNRADYVVMNAMNYLCPDTFRMH